MTTIEKLEQEYRQKPSFVLPPLMIVAGALLFGGVIFLGVAEVLPWPVVILGAACLLAEGLTAYWLRRTRQQEGPFVWYLRYLMDGSQDFLTMREVRDNLDNDHLPEEFRDLPDNWYMCHDGKSATWYPAGHIPADLALVPYLERYANQGKCAATVEHLHRTIGREWMPATVSGAPDDFVVYLRDGTWDICHPELVPADLRTRIHA